MLYALCCIREDQSREDRYWRREKGEREGISVQGLACFTLPCYLLYLVKPLPVFHSAGSTDGSLSLSLPLEFPLLYWNQKGGVNRCFALSLSLRFVLPVSQSVSRSPYRYLTMWCKEDINTVCSLHTMWCTDGVTVMQREKNLRRLVETGTEKWPEGRGGRRRAGRW